MSQMPPPGPPLGPPGPRSGAPAPPPTAPRPMGWLLLTLQGSPLTSSMITPAVLVNGWRVPAQYGDNVIPVHAGPNRIDVSCQWLRKYGRATLETTVPDGGQVPVFYAAPLHMLSRGLLEYDSKIAECRRCDEAKLMILKRWRQVGWGSPAVMLK